MKETLNLMRMKEIGRFANAINGIRFGKDWTIGRESFSNDDFSKSGILQEIVVISFEDFVLLQKVDA
jgi:hypothetical protein